MNYKINENCKKIYLIGIGGVSMSGIALILKDWNYDIVGTDRELSQPVENLIKNDIKVNIGHSYDNITDDIDLVVRTAAIKDDNEEVRSARDKGIEVIDRATMLGFILSKYDNSICIAGTHGKTTTTSIVSEILIKAEKNPTITVGGHLPSINGNLKIGEKDYIVAEACEYVNSFLKFYPTVAGILNVEHDHLDFFKTFDDVLNSFNQFAKNVDDNGYLIINSDIKGISKILDGVKCNIITFGKKDADYTFDVIDIDEKGYPTFNILNNGKIVCSTKINMPGEYNILNAVAGFAISMALNLNKDNVANSIKEYRGVDRRFQFKGYFNEIPVVDDYAHHPTEITSLLTAVKKGSYNKIFTIFQSHTYTRTKELLEEFGVSLKDSDVIYVADIYSARETNVYNIHPEDVVNEIKKYNKNAKYVQNYEEVKESLLKEAKKGDIILTVGAGDIYLLGEYLID